MSDVANNGLILHLVHVGTGDDVFVTCCRHKNVCLVNSIVHGYDTVAFHRSLQGADRIHLSYPHLRRQGTQGLGAALADVAVAGNDRNLTGDHDIGCTLDAVDQGLTATVQVVKFTLGH